MATPRRADVSFWSVTAIAAVVLNLLVLVLVGVFPLQDTDGGGEAETSLAPMPAPARETQPEPSVARPARTKAAPPPKPEPRLATVTVTAARGDCWISARAGSETGRLLDERLLVQGESVRLRGRRIWLSLGASGNVDVLVDGEPHPVSSGTVAVVLAPESEA